MKGGDLIVVVYEDNREECSYEFTEKVFGFTFEGNLYSNKGTTPEKLNNVKGVVIKEIFPIIKVKGFTLDLYLKGVQ